MKKQSLAFLFLLLSPILAKAVPPPSISSLSPSSSTLDSPGFTLTVNGSDFFNGGENVAVIYWNGSGLDTTYVNGNQLTAIVPSSDLLTVGTATVQAIREDGQESNTVDFYVGPQAFNPDSQANAFEIRDKQNNLLATYSNTENNFSINVSSFTLNNSILGQSITFFGALTGAQLEQASCPNFNSGISGCFAFNLSDFDLYTATGSGIGQWRNEYTRNGP